MSLTCSRVPGGGWGMERSSLLHQVPGSGCCQQHLWGRGLKRVSLARVCVPLCPSEPYWGGQQASSNGIVKAVCRKERARSGRENTASPHRCAEVGDGHGK